MSIGEVLLVLIVALLVFGPQKLPDAARHLARLVRFVIHYKAQFSQFWDKQMQAYQLLDNEEKAAQADKQYQSSDNRSTNE